MNDYVEIKQDDLDDIPFFKSLRDCNVPTDLTIEGKDGSVFVHRLVIKSYSSSLDNGSTIQVKGAHVEDLASFVKFFYEGKCVVQRERLHQLLELSHKMRLKTLEATLKKIINSRNNVDERVEQPKRLSQLATEYQTVVTGKPSSKTGTDGNFQTHAGPSNGSQLDKRSVKIQTAVNVNYKEEARNQQRFSVNASTKNQGRRSHHTWTKKQNEIFLSCWLEELEHPEYDYSSKIIETMADAGVFLSVKNIAARKWMFKNMYKKQRMGQRQRYIKEYLNQLDKIFEIEYDFAPTTEDSVTGFDANENSSNFSYSDDPAESFINEESSSNVSGQIEMNADDDNESMPDSPEVLIISNANVPHNSMTANGNGQQPGKESSKLDRFFTPEMINIMLTLWLKHVRGGIPRKFNDIVDEIVDALAEKGFRTTRQKLMTKKFNLTRIWRQHKLGHPQPGVIPYLTLLDEILASESSVN